MESAERFMVARRYEYCLNCLASTYNVYSCDSPDTCMYCGRLHHTLLHPSRHPRVTAPEGSAQNRLGEQVRPIHRDYRHRLNPHRRRLTNSPNHRTITIHRRNTTSSHRHRHRTANTNHQHHRRHTTNFHRRRTNTSSIRTSRQHQRRINSTTISRPNNVPPDMPNRVISEAILSLAAVLCATSNN
ncbi:hypothetical protein FF38_03888 [Lucilia cuprina]|uniref:Uncharacterized protein n=1 Tax=Lucilia cuprina TaxID=7375 RepID=A0A0L0BT73_LUCCU|nr:hypothetical protein FF38_03888 [Lucilia cuprina]